MGDGETHNTLPPVCVGQQAAAVLPDAWSYSTLGQDRAFVKGQAGTAEGQQECTERAQFLL